MGRKPCCEKVGLKRGPWTTEEDQKLVSYITNNGLGCWRAIPKLAGLLRCGKSCRLRWTNYLRPDLKRGIFSEAEENLILDLHATLGNRWSRIAAQLPGRTDNEIKNYWNTRLKKRLRSQGLDPATHLPLESDGTGGDTDTGEDGYSSDAVMSDPRGPKSETRVKKPKKPQEPAKVRQPKGPKPAPQLKMCQSKEGLVLLKVLNSPKPSSKSPKSPKSPKSTTSVNPGGCKCDDDSEQSSSSTGTTSVSTEDTNQGSTLGSKLTTIPSYPEAKVWESIKAASTSSSSTCSLLDAWETYRDDPTLVLSPCSSQAANTVFSKPAPGGMMVHASHETVSTGLQFNPQPAAAAAHEVGESYGGLFQGECFPQAEIGMPWTMDGDYMAGTPAAPESLYGSSINPLNPTCYYEELQQPVSQVHTSQELQRLSALLDLI